MPPARTNISLPPELLAKAKQYNINISQAARDGIVAAIRREMEINCLSREMQMHLQRRMGC